MIHDRAETYREEQKVRNRRLYEKRAAEIDEQRAKQGLPKIYRKSLASPEERAQHNAAVKAKARESVKRYQQEHAEEISVKKAIYYQKNKNRYRLNGAIRRTKESIRRFEAQGNQKKALEARERLARYEAELAELVRTTG